VVLDAGIGPFHDTAGVAALLGGVLQQAVEARRTEHTVLTVKTADGRWAYPTFQFTGSDVDPALVPAIQALQDAPAWSAALWFLTPSPDLDRTGTCLHRWRGRATDARPTCWSPAPGGPPRLAVSR
jgi:hypothetical protein